MSGLFPFPALLFGLLGCGACLLAACRIRRARLDQAAAERRCAGYARCLGLVAEEMLGPALALRARADALPEAAGTALRQESDRLLLLADELKEVLAASAGPRALREEAVALAPLLREAVAAAEAQLGPARRQWRLSGEFEGMSLHADARALRGALRQVLARAARLTRDGDWIDLRPVSTPDSLAIVVEDEGAGLHAEDLAPGAGTTSEQTRGLSFGLAVARALLEAHGGELRLEAAPGIGARAWLTLPRERLLTA